MKKLPALFIGRWQPFHDGHKRLIETVLEEGQDVIVAVRDTIKSAQNPYSFAERQKMILNALGTWNKADRSCSRIRVIKIPDIGSVCYGRKVGYDVREIRLDEKTEEISGTALRAVLGYRHGV